MKRALWMVPVLAMFFSIGCAVRATYYSRPGYRGPYYYQHHRNDHDRDDHRWR
jgi:hypothetical protein